MCIRDRNRPPFFFLYSYCAPAISPPSTPTSRPTSLVFHWPPNNLDPPTAPNKPPTTAPTAAPTGPKLAPAVAPSFAPPQPPKPPAAAPFNPEFWYPMNAPPMPAIQGAAAAALPSDAPAPVNPLSL